MSEVSAFERLGGAAAVRTIVDDFQERVYSDMMIGFYFQNVDQSRIKEMEYQLAANFLGGPVEYGGRDIFKAHSRHRIAGGQFMRRMMILKKTLKDHNVPEDIAQEWVAHNEALRGAVTGDKGSECQHDRPTKE